MGFLACTKHILLYFRANRTAHETNGLYVAMRLLPSDQRTHTGSKSTQLYSYLLHKNVRWLVSYPSVRRSRPTIAPVLDTGGMTRLTDECETIVGIAMPSDQCSVSFLTWSVALYCVKPQVKCVHEPTLMRSACTGDRDSSGEGPRPGTTFA